MADKPITRKELFLAKAGGQDVKTPEPITREELFLAKVAGEDVETPRPITREELFLAKAGGKDVKTPDPITREELFLAKVAGNDVKIPSPITRVERFLEAISSGGGTATTLTGQTSPIPLIDAIAGRIQSLLQYGKVSQASTPTPSVPVDIYCNNGKLVAVDDELPLGYKRIESIAFDGDFHYETGEAMSGDDDVTMTLANTVTQGQNIFGSYNGTSSGTKNFSLFIYGNGSASGSYFRYGEQLLRPKFGSEERTITFGKSGTDGFATDASATPEEFTTPANAYIGMLPNSTSPSFSGTIVGNIPVGSRLKYIPCERQNDGVIGYYEAVKGAFLEPVGTGTPVKGAYDHSHETIIMVEGTPEVISVTASGAEAQAATAVDLFAVGDVKDTQDIVSGVVTRACGVCVYDGTQPVGNDFVSTTGGKDVGAIIIYPLAAPITEQVAAQPLNTAVGDNTITVTAEVSDIEFDVTYYKSREA